MRPSYFQGVELLDVSGFSRSRRTETEKWSSSSRLVAHGFSQVPGVDFEETYAPVGRLTSLQVLLALSANHDLELSQADVEGAYLNGKS